MLRPRVAPSRRSLETPNGKPFFWLADTAWELFHRLTKEEALRYLDNRAELGFNVILAVGLAELNGVRVPNREGHLPLINEDPTQLNAPYWDHVEWVIDHAAQRGLYTAFLPTWGDKITPMWGDGPVIFTEANARVYGRLVAQRLGRYDSLIWVNGGDRPADKNTEIWQALAEGLLEGDGGKVRLMTWHPVGESSSSSVWHKADWLDFNMLQTSHGRHEVRPDSFIDHDLSLDPPKPVLDGEPRYENHPVFSDRTLPYFNAHDVRRAIYLGVFAGGCGATYGCHAIWQMATAAEPTINAPIGTWEYSLDLPGAKQLQHLKSLMLQVEFHKMSPDSKVMGGRATDVRTLVKQDGSLIAAYVPPGIMPPLELNLPEGAWIGEWFDPRTGVVTGFGEVTGKVIQPTWASQESDWVLVLRRQS